MTDDEVQEELEQIALEREIVEDSAMPTEGDVPPYPDNQDPTGGGEEEEDVPQEIDFSEGDEK